MEFPTMLLKTFCIFQGVLDVVPSVSEESVPQGSDDVVPGVSGRKAPQGSVDVVPGVSGRKAPQGSLDVVPGVSGRKSPQAVLEEIFGQENVPPTDGAAQAPVSIAIFFLPCKPISNKKRKVWKNSVD